MAEFEKQTCVVTGGGRGIGRAIVEMFAAEGAEVHSLDAVAQQNPVGHGNAHFKHCDITDLSTVEAFFAWLHACGKSVDVLVNNAATVTRAVPITDLSPQEWQRTIDVNITGAFNVTRSALALMGKGGRIINIASTFAHVGSPGRVAYSTTKGAILAFTRSLALDTAAHGIRVNSISPGGIATDRLIELFGSQQAAESHLAQLHPVGHTGKPADIANAVWYLASRRSTFMTGADLLVDGGYTAQ
ncbi:SDR family NAD(P)-dependent oxidoreductase [Microvirga flavescens]|uniref:SDR family NAD(P)-dependent oxidoreductase n=1 Tax=Microvirga flavescens TaxID=2249811 RepID=UPI0013008FF1|nr:SDR family oxidoreductase [Microvirga flavescens]